MLEKQLDILLFYLYDICSDESFKILDVPDILSELSESISDYATLQLVVFKLSEQGYVKISFFDNDEMCFAVTQRGKRYVEELRYQEEMRRREREEAERKKRLEEEERAQRAKMEEEARLQRERLEEEKRQAALEVERMIEETKERMKTMKRSERTEAQRTIEQLASDENYREIVVREEAPVEETAPESAEVVEVQSQPVAVQPAIGGIVRKVFLAAFFGSALGTAIIALLFKLIG